MKPEHWSHTGPPEVNAECPRCYVDRLEAQLERVAEALKSDLAATITRMDEYVQAGLTSKADVLHEVIETMRTALAAAQPASQEGKP
jgi:hypothetical protein